MSLTNDQQLTVYLQDIEDINWLLKVRALTGDEKADEIMSKNSTYAQKVCNHFWAFNDQDLERIKHTRQVKISKIISEVDINQIL